MKKIQMVDLKGQYAPIKELVNSSIQEVIDTASFINFFIAFSKLE